MQEEQTKLEEEDIEEFYQIDESAILQAKEASRQLYKWQEEAIQYFFNPHNKRIKILKAIFQCPTGAGKTTLAIEIIKEILIRDPTTKILIVVPKNVILETGWYKELYDAGISLTDIGVYYGAIKEYAKITITNMQNLKNIDYRKMKCVVLDEIHNYGTSNIMNILNQTEWQYMIGLTATLKRLDGQHWKIAEMFDCRIFEYTAKEALTDNILSPFEATEIMIKLDSFTRDQYDKLTQEINALMAQAGGYTNMMRGNFKNIALAKMIERKQLVNNYPKKPSIIAKICQKHISEKMIVFNEYNEQTSKMYWELLDCGVKSCVFHSNIPQKVREQHLIDFRNGKYNVILASKVLDEGWNLPKLSCAIISAGNSTNRQTIQRLGRILRKQKDKLAKLYILTVENTIEDKYAEEKRKFLKLIAEKYTTISEDEL